MLPEISTIREELEPVEYEVEYPNYRMEDKERQIPYYPSTEKGTLQYKHSPICNHKLVPAQEPKHRNCEACWFAFFQLHGELTQAVEELFAKQGGDPIRRLRGPKFLKNFLKFMSTVARYKQAIEDQKGDNDVSTGRATSSNETT